VRRCEWLSRIPKTGFLPHTSQTDAMASHTLFADRHGTRRC
jgi:hypothetical protein